MKFKNRIDAGRQLAAHLGMFADRDDTVVLGLPRGGVPVAAEIARCLHLPLDVFLSRRLAVPGHEELAFGAVSTGGGLYLDQRIVQTSGVSDQQIAAASKHTRNTLEDLARLYRSELPALPLRNKIVVLVDDGVASGAGLAAALRALCSLHPRKVIVAAPVASQASCIALQRQADVVIVLQTPPDFYSVGQFYEDFAHVSDENVQDLLRRHALQGRFPGEAVPVDIPVSGHSVPGLLSLVPGSDTLVIFVHGSGSSRLSPRNQHVAEFLQQQGLSTLLFDLLTLREEAQDRYTTALRFDIALLAGRLLQVVDWVRQQPQTSHVKLALFGASTGTAAALKAAAQLGHEVSCVVSRGGRPDLAAQDLRNVHCPTLLIVGGADETVLALNRKALESLPCKKELTIVPGATHLFEEHAALDRVAALAADWILRWSQAASVNHTFRSVA